MVANVEKIISKQAQDAAFGAPGESGDPELIDALYQEAVLGLVRPRWAVVGCVVIAAAYLAPRLEFINSAYGLLDSLKFWDNAGGVVKTTTGTKGQIFTSQISSLPQ